MAKQATCHRCVYAHWDRVLWMRSLGSGWPARPTCGNQPDSYGRMKECPCGAVCRNYRARPPVPTGEGVKTIPLGDGRVRLCGRRGLRVAQSVALASVRQRVRGATREGQEDLHASRDHEAAARARSWTTSMATSSTIPGPICGTSRQQQNMHNKGKHLGSCLHLQGRQLRREAHRWEARI